MWQNDPVIGNPLPTTRAINSPGSALAPIRPNSNNLSPQEDLPLPPPPAPPVPGVNAQPQAAPTATWEQDPVVPQEPTQDWQNDPVTPPRDFRNIYEDQELSEVAREFYRQRDGLQLSAPEAVSRFVSDRTWKQANTGSALIEFGSSQRMAPEQSERLRYLKDYWDTLPDFYQTGGRGGLGVVMNLAAGASDPVNALGVVGRGLGTLARLGRTAAVDAGVTAATNVAEQATDINIGRRTSISPTEAAIAGGVGALASLGGNVLVSGAGRYMRQSTGSPHLDAQRDAKIGAPPEDSVSIPERFREFVDNRNADLFDQTAPLENIQRAATGIGTSPRELRDAYRTATPDDIDPINGVHYQARMLAGSSGRVEDFALRGGVLPPDTTNPTIRENNFEVGVSPALAEVYAPHHASGQTENFNMYLMALRARYIRDVVNPHVMTEARNEVLAGRARTPLESQQDYAQVVALGGGRRGVETQQEFLARANAAAEKARKPTLFEDSQAFLDNGVARTPQEAQIYAARSIDDWIAFGDARPDFVNSRNQYKQIMDTNLEYERRSGVLSANDIVNITGGRYDNPRNVPFFYTPYLPSQIGSRAIKGGKVILGSSPGRARLKGGTGNRMDVEEATLSHIHRVVNSSDRNRMKLAFYRNLDSAIANGSIKAGEVASKVRMDKKELLQRFYSDPDNGAMLRRAGITTDAFNTSPEDILRVMALNNWKGGGKDNIDIVYRDGKVETWRIHDPDVLNALHPHMLESDSGMFLDAVNAFARYRSAWIMANPGTMAVNALRDTISSAMSSPLGFTPGVTTAKGMVGVFRAPLLNALQAVTKKIPGNPGLGAIQREIAAGDAYRKAWASGMGYSGQIKTALATNRLSLRKNRGVVGNAYDGFMDYLQNNIIGKGARGWLEFSNRVEMASRMGEYYLAKNMGMSDVAASYMGREVATDFGQRGRSPFFRKVMNATSFLNAGMQSIHKLGRLATKHPGKLLAGMAVYAVFDAVTHAINSGHPSYVDQSEVVKAQNVLIPIYTDEGEAWRWLTGEQTEFYWAVDRDPNNPNAYLRSRNAPEVRYVPVPKPFEFGTLGTLINGMMDTISTRNGDHIRDAFVTSLTTAIPNIHAPDIAQPFWDLWRNKDGLGRTITPEALNRPGVSNLSRFTERTPEWARAAAQSLSEVTAMFSAPGKEPDSPLSPIQIEYLANYIMPGLMNAPVQAVTAATHDEARTGERATARPDEADVVRDPMSLLTRRFIVPGTSRSSPALNQLYEIKQRADALVGVERLDETDLFRMIGYDPSTMSQERMQAITSSSTIRGALDIIRTLTVQAQSISISTELNADEKRQQLDANMQLRNDTARDIITLIQRSDLSDRLMATFFNDPRNDLPRQNIIRQTIENFRRD